MKFGWTDQSRETASEFYELVTEAGDVISKTSYQTFEEALNAGREFLKSNAPGMVVTVWGFQKRATLKIIPTDPIVTHHNVNYQPQLPPPVVVEEPKA